MVAYDKITGEPRWRAVNEKIAYASPVVTELQGTRQMLVFTGGRFLGMNPADGAVHWEFPWKVQYDNAIAQPVVVAANRVFISAGYGKGCALLEFKRTGDQWSVEELWRNLNLKNKFSSSVLHEGFLYGLDEDRLVCVEVATGRKAWKDGKYGYGQIVLAGGHVIVACGDGDLALVKCNPVRHEEIARFPALDGKTWNHPVLADGRLLIRNATKMACFDVSVAVVAGTQ